MDGEIDGLHYDSEADLVHAPEARIGLGRTGFAAPGWYAHSSHVTGQGAGQRGDSVVFSDLGSGRASQCGRTAAARI